jgi:carboxypeptidase Taq
MNAHKAYEKIKKHMQEHWMLWSASFLAEWDQETYMPTGGGEARSKMLGILARLTHEMFTDSKVNDWLCECENSDLVIGDTKEAANIRELRRQYNRKTRLPKEFVEEEARLYSKSQQVWIEARKKSDFSMFAPYLKKILSMQQKKADFFGYETEAYDALMDEFEPGATADEVESVFKGLLPELVSLNAKLKDAPRRPDIGIIKRPYDVNKQRILTEIVVSSFGYDFNEGRIDEVAHPFCTSFGPGDHRICTRYYPEDIAEGLTGAMHEAGHALYDMGLNREEYGMPCGDATSLSLHESQSRLWENQIGRSEGFWEYFFPQVQRIFKDSLSGVSLEEFYHAMNYSTPSYIRVEADEATYNLHIMLRFEIEREMMRGNLKVDDIPGEWDKRFYEYFGIEVDKVSNGCLQDVHWAQGCIGYFPTYCLGNLYAAQFYAKVNEELPSLESDFSRGNFSRLLKWLRENIHTHGSRYRSADLCQKVTGKQLSHQPLIDYLTVKYKDIYGI